MPVKRQTRKQTRKNRPSPSESATLFPEGTIRKGGKGQWVVKKTTSGIHRWVPEESVELYGLRRLTVNYMETMIGKEIKIYLREYSDEWPSQKSLKGDLDLRFVPSGDARVNKKVVENWLHTRSPSIKKGQSFNVLGSGFYVNGRGETYEDMELQVDSADGQMISPNLMNTAAFVKI